MFTIRGRVGRLPGIGSLWALLVTASLAQNQEIFLWPKGAPLANGTISTGTALTDKPSITPYPSAHPNGAAILIFPGGGYQSLTMGYEGMDPAKYFASQGVSGFVVKYRLGSNGYHHPIEMWDGQRALRWVHAHAAQYGVDTSRIGVLGFSAGGHLAATVSTHYDNGNPAAADSIDRQPCRPAFSVLGYAIITMDASFTHMDSRNNLLGTNPSQAVVDSLSNEKQVNDRTPPAFLFHAADDPVVPLKNPQSYTDSLTKHHIPVTYVKFDHGGHGFGMADGKDGAPNIPADYVWCDSSVKWLDKQGFFQAKPASLAAPSTHAGANSRRPAVLLEDRGGRASDALGRRARAFRSPAARLPVRSDVP